MKLKLLIHKITFLVFMGISFFLNAQEYGDNFVVFEGEATTNSFSATGEWKVRTPADGVTYQEYVDDPTAGIEPFYDTYIEYKGGWDNAVDELEYTFICPKSGNYQVSMRMHSPLRDGEAADQRNDVRIKMEGNFVTASTVFSTEQLETYEKYFGRAANKWGALYNLDIHNTQQNPPRYALTEGEEYTLKMKGRSPTTCIDYIVIYELAGEANVWVSGGEDLALVLPQTHRPGLGLVDPTDLTVVPETADVREGESIQLSIDWQPSNAKKDVTWLSSDTSIFTVDENGLVTAVGEIGETATITATSDIDGSLSSSSVLTIVEWYAITIENVTVTPEENNIVETEELQLTATITPVDTDDTALTWSSSDSGIASVNQNGLVTGVGIGSAIIRATSIVDNTKYDEVTVNVAELVEPSVTFDDTSKYKDGIFYVNGTIDVTVNYNAGSFETVDDKIRFYFRHIDENWSVVEDIDVIDVIEHNGTKSGTASATLQLADILPSADLLDGHFYFLFVKAFYTNGVSATMGIQPIQVEAETASVSIFKNVIGKIYPNPASENIFIQTDKDLSNSYYSIYSSIGNLVSYGTVNNQNKKINISSLQSGIYILKVENEYFSASQKIIIK